MTFRLPSSLGIAASGACLLVSAAQSATIIYQDDFDNDGLAVNTGIGGGLMTRSLRGGHHNWTDNGNLQFNTTGNTNFENRVLGSSTNSFMSPDGFELEVDLFQTSYGGASRLAFGLVSTDTNLTTYTGPATGSLNPFTDPAVYGFGATNDSGDLSFVDGTSSTVLDNDTAFTLNNVHTAILRFANNGSGGANWSWSLDGTSLGSGTVASFDFSKSFHFLAYGQDDQGNKRIESVQLTALMAIPEPSRATLLGLGLGSLLLRRRR